LRIIEDETGKDITGAAPLVSRPPLSLTPLRFFAGLEKKDA